MMRKGFVVIAVAGLVLAGCSDQLTSAVVSGDVDAVQTLLDDGAHPDAFISFRHPKFAGGNKVRRRLLVAAAVHGHTDVAELLIGSGATLSHPHNEFAICPAAALGHVDMVILLIQVGVPPNPRRKCGERGDKTPLQIAEARGHFDITRVLRDAGARH